jgi:hypothetical protein
VTADPILAMTIRIDVIIAAIITTMTDATITVVTTALISTIEVIVVMITTTIVTTTGVTIDVARTTTTANTTTARSGHLRHHPKGATPMVHSRRPAARSTSYTICRVCLPVTFGTEENFRTEYLTFEVADFRPSYHAIFGRPMLAKFMAIPHHTYLIMKMPAPNGILSVLGDIMVSYNCESATVELSKDSAIKAAATVMVA